MIPSSALSVFSRGKGLFRKALIAAPLVILLHGVSTADESQVIAQAFLESNAVLDQWPSAPDDFEAIHSEIARRGDPESKFGYIVFSIARHGEKLLTEEQRTQLTDLIGKRAAATIDWHDVRNLIRVKAQVALWEYAAETDLALAAKLKRDWDSWTDLRIAYMEQEFFDKERFQRAAWNLLTEKNKEDLLGGKWDRYLKKEAGHGRLFSADKQVTRVLGKPDKPEAFNKVKGVWRTQWNIMWNAFQSESEFERKREFSMDVADETFAITSWRQNYVPGFREFAEHECDAIRALVQAGYKIDGEARIEIENYRGNLRKGALEKHKELPPEIHALLQE